MTPTYFYSLGNNYPQYFNNQYPVATDCKILDQQILLIQKDIDNINKRILMQYPDITQEMASTNSVVKNVYLTIAAKIRENSLNYLKILLVTKKSSYSSGDCRNKIELVRQEETAAVFSETSAKQEENVLTQSKSKQYFLIGAGSLLLLTTLIVVLIKRKKLET